MSTPKTSIEQVWKTVRHDNMHVHDALCHWNKNKAEG
jgi:hypothetical protein